MKLILSFMRTGSVLERSVVATHFSFRSLKTLTLAGFVALSFLTGCGGDDDGGANTKTFEEQAAPVIERYAEIGLKSYGDSVAKVDALKSAIDAFLAAPSATTLAAARTAWVDARVPYLQTEVYRFYGGPIDVDGGPEGFINAWPLDEKYIDYVKDAPDAGIINKNPDGTIDAQGLTDLNEGEGETTISTGYHAIEFLLWGQDLSETGPGDRPATDYLVPGGTHANQERRRQYLTVATQLLRDDLQSVVDAWQTGKSNYRASFVASAPKDALQNILLGMGSLSGGELSGERMQVAYESKEQEDEHSCFSDTTHRDLYYDAVGIQNAYLGRYGDVDGPGLDDLVKAKDPALDARIKSQLQAAVDAIHAIPAPFDQAIKGLDDAPGRKQIKASIEALLAVTVSIVDVAKLFDIELNLEQ
jgi:putative iron-regulated protein